MTNNPVSYNQKLLITLLSCILLAVISYRLCISPDLQKLESLNMEYDTAEMTLDILNDKINNFNDDNSDKTIEKYIEEYDAVTKNIFEYLNTEDICLNISQLFSEQSLEIDSFSVSEQQPFIVYDDVNDEQIQIDNIYFSKVTISSYGEFRSIINLIDSINNTPSSAVECFNISDINSGSADFYIVIDIFMYNDSLIDWGEKF